MTGPGGPEVPALVPLHRAGQWDQAEPAGRSAPSDVPDLSDEVTRDDLAGGPQGEHGQDQFEAEQRDWAWVEEWREGNEPMPWGPGLAIAAFTGFLVASAVYVLSSGLSAKPLVAIGVNVVVVAGLCPALWLSRGLPVLRWVAGGAAAGVLIAWLAVLVILA